MQLAYQLNSAAQTAVVYSITDASGFTYYVGRCSIADMNRLPDMRWHPTAGELLKNHEFTQNMIVQVWGMLPQFDETASNYYWSIVQHLKAPHERTWVPKPEGFVLPKFKSVRCIETGTEYDSAAEACRANGIQASNMSAHLNGTGSRKVGGKSYEYIV